MTAYCPLDLIVSCDMSLMIKWMCVCVCGSVNWSSAKHTWQKCGGFFLMPTRTAYSHPTYAHTPIHLGLCVCVKGLLKDDISHPQSIAKNFTGTHLWNRVTELLLSVDSAWYRDCTQTRENSASSPGVEGVHWRESTVQRRQLKESWKGEDNLLRGGVGRGKQTSTKHPAV